MALNLKPGSYCCVRHCGNKGAAGFFRFPKDPVLRDRWRKIVGPKGSWHENLMVCQRHFDQSDIQRYSLTGAPMKRMKLKNRCILPHLNVPYPESSETMTSDCGTDSFLGVIETKFVAVNDETGIWWKKCNNVDDAFVSKNCPVINSEPLENDVKVKKKSVSTKTPNRSKIMSEPSKYERSNVGNPLVKKNTPNIIARNRHRIISEYDVKVKKKTRNRSKKIICDPLEYDRNNVDKDPLSIVKSELEFDADSWQNITSNSTQYCGIVPKSEDGIASNNAEKVPKSEGITSDTEAGIRSKHGEVKELYQTDTIYIKSEKM